MIAVHVKDEATYYFDESEYTVAEAKERAIEWFDERKPMMAVEIGEEDDLL